MAFFSRVFLPFLLLGYIATETFMKLQNTSLCGKVGCTLAGELLRFDTLYLHYAGIVSILTLLVLGYYSRKSKLVEKLFFIVLYTAIAFEATILFYQLIANPEPCLFCLGIFSSLLLIALLSNSQRFPMVIAIVLAIYVGLSSLAINKNKSYVNTNAVYLIQSDSCPHCTKVKTYFSEQKIEYTPISVTEVSARSFLKFIDISTIPVAVIKDKHNVKIINGDANIIAHFKKQKSSSSEASVPESIPSQSASLGVPMDIFNVSSEPGCAITIVEAPACDDDNKSP